MPVERLLSTRVTRYNPISIWEIWSSDMGDDSIDKVISHIDVGYLVSLLSTTPLPGSAPAPRAPRPPHATSTRSASAS